MVEQALNFIRLNVKSESEFGQIANGKYELKGIKWHLLKALRITCNILFCGWIAYLIFY